MSNIFDMESLTPIRVSESIVQMRILAEFLRGLIRHWWSLMSCAAFTFLSVIAVLVKDSNKFILIGTAVMGVLFLLVASFGAWLDMRLRWQSADQDIRKLQQALRDPDIDIEANGVSDGILGDRVVVIFMAAVTNPRGPQTALYEWDLFIEFADRRVHATPLIPNKDGVDTKLGASGRSGRLTTDRFFPMQQEVIPVGGRIEGWFWGAFRQDEIEGFRESAKAVLCVRDAVAKKSHEAKIAFGVGVSIPGITDTDWIPESARRRP